MSASTKYRPPTHQSLLQKRLHAFGNTRAIVGGEAQTFGTILPDVIQRIELHCYQQHPPQSPLLDEAIDGLKQLHHAIEDLQKAHPQDRLRSSGIFSGAPLFLEAAQQAIAKTLDPADEITSRTLYALGMYKATLVENFTDQLQHAHSDRIARRNTHVPPAEASQTAPERGTGELVKNSHSLLKHLHDFIQDAHHLQTVNAPGETGISNQRIQRAQTGLSDLMQAIYTVYRYSNRDLDVPASNAEVKPTEQHLRAIKTWSVPLAEYGAAVEAVYRADPQNGEQLKKVRMDNIAAFSESMSQIVDLQHYNTRSDYSVPRFVRPKLPAPTEEEAGKSREELHQSLLAFFQRPIVNDDTPYTFLGRVLGDIHSIEQNCASHLALNPQLADQLPTKEELENTRQSVVALQNALHRWEKNNAEFVTKSEFDNNMDTEIARNWQIPFDRYKQVLDKFFDTGEQIYQNGTCDKMKQYRMQALEAYTHAFSETFAPLVESLQQSIGRA